MLGCELTEPWRGHSRDFIKATLEEGLLVLVAGPDVIRLAPSLIIPDDLIEEGLRRFERAIARLSSQTAPAGEELSLIHISPSGREKHWSRHAPFRLPPRSR